MNSPSMLTGAIAPKVPGKGAAGRSSDVDSAPNNDSNYASKFMKKRLKEADNSYSYEVDGKLPDGSMTKWKINFDQTLEYLMYPSLNILDDEPVPIDKEESSRPTSRGRVGQGSPLGRAGGGGGSDMGKSLSMEPSGEFSSSRGRTRGIKGKTRGERSPSRSSPSPDRRNRGTRSAFGGGSRTSSPHAMGKRADALIDEFLSEGEEEPQTEDGDEAGDDMLGVHRPEIMWEVDVTAVDKLPETEAQKKRRNFQKRVDEIGEDYLRGGLRRQFEEERQRKLRQLAEESRESSFKRLKGTSSKLKKDQSSLSKAIDAVVPQDRFNMRRGNASRRESSRGNGNMMEIMNRPEYIYSSLRSAALKKKVLSGMDMKVDNEDDESVYRRQKTGLEELLKTTDRGHVDTAFEMEGLLYYRFHYDAEHEAMLKKTREEEETRAHTRQGGTITYSPTKQRASRTGGGSGGDGDDIQKSVEEEAQNKSEYEKLMVQVYKGTRREPVAATLESDLNAINLGRLRRAINQRLSSLDRDYLLDQRELQALKSPKHGDEEEENEENTAENMKSTPTKKNNDKKNKEKGLRFPSPSPSRNLSPSAKPGEGSPVGTPISPIKRKKIVGRDKKRKTKATPLSHMSPLRPDAEQLDDDAPLHEIRDRALNQYIKSMGLENYKGSAGAAFGIGTTTAVADSVDTKLQHSNLIKGLGGVDTPSEKIMTDLQMKMSGGLSNKEIQKKTIGIDDEHQSISGSTRVAQDALLMNQLRAGIIPEQYIRRSNTLDHLDIDINKYSIGDEQGACLGKAIAGLGTLRSLILEDNRLTSKSIPIIVRNLNTSNLILLDISCNNAHNSGASAIATYLKGESMLTELRMNNCSLQDDDMPPICQALKNNRKSRLTSLKVNSNKVGPEGAKIVAKLLSAPGCKIADLDISWNNICTEGTMSIANALKMCECIQVINLTACSIDDKGGQALAATLKHNKSLKSMILSKNNITGGACFVFSKTTLDHPTIGLVDLSMNPVGEAGARSIYRRIMRGLRCYIVLRKCTYFYDDKIFNYSTPSLDSPYHLDMEVAYQAAVMQELIYMVMEHSSTCRFGHVTYQQTPNSPIEEYKLSLVDGQVVLKGKKFELPSTGTLTVEFFSSVTMPSMKNKAKDSTVALMHLIVKGADEEDYLDYIRLITADLYFTCKQVQDIIQVFIENQIIGTGTVRPMDVLACTWTHLIDTRNMYDFMIKNIPKNERKSLINEVTIDEYRFNWTNPTGHWRLNLGMHKQLFVMMKLVAINKVESDFSKDFQQSGRDDTSQEGTWYNFRNAQFVTNRGSRSIVIDQEFVEHLPRSGIIDFDYVSTTRPGAPHMMEQEFIDLLVPPKANVLAGGNGRRASIMGSDDVVPDTALLKSTSSSKKAPSVLDKYEVISDDDFYSFLETMELSSRERISVSDSLWPLMYLQLAVTKYWFTVKHVMMVIDCFENETQTQANVTCVFFSRIFDLGNMDVLFRSLQKPAQRLILKRLGCLNVLNPLKLALDYKISMKHLDERILLTTLLEISPQEGTDQIREDPKTDVSVLTFYGALHRIVAMERDDFLLFTYLETGVASNVVAWSLRRDALKKFLVGTKPVDRALFRVVGMYREMEKNGTLSRGPIELQYMTHLKIMKKSNRKKALSATGQKAVDAMRSATTDSGVAGAGLNAALALSTHRLSEDQIGISVQPRLGGDMKASETTTGEAVLAAATITETKEVEIPENKHHDDHEEVVTATHVDEHMGDDMVGHLDDQDDDALFGTSDENEGSEQEHEGEETSTIAQGVDKGGSV